MTSEVVGIENQKPGSTGLTVVPGLPLGKACPNCGGPVCTGIASSNEYKVKVLVCAWCKDIVWPD
jgi:hypothetical protein